MSRSRTRKRKTTAQSRRVEAFTLGMHDYYSVFRVRVEEHRLDRATFHADFGTAKSQLLELIDREIAWLAQRRAEVAALPADDCLRVDPDTLAPARPLAADGAD